MSSTRGVQSYSPLETRRGRLKEKREGKGKEGEKKEERKEEAALRGSGSSKAMLYHVVWRVWEVIKCTNSHIQDQELQSVRCHPACGQLCKVEEEDSAFQISAS